MKLYVTQHTSSTHENSFGLDGAKLLISALTLQWVHTEPANNEHLPLRLSLYTARNLFESHFTWSLKNNLCTAVTRHNATENSDINSHAKHKTDFHANVFLIGIHRLLGIQFEIVLTSSVYIPAFSNHLQRPDLRHPYRNVHMPTEFTAFLRKQTTCAKYL